MNYDHDHPELCPLPDCKSLGADPEAPAGRFRVLSRPTLAAPPRDAPRGRRDGAPDRRLKPTG
jgi:hypothetical protein